MTELEYERLAVRAGFLPDLGSKERITKGDLACPLLKHDECSVYEVRPLICRLWGLVEKMKCPHGCVPERWLTDEEALAILRENRTLSQHS